MKIPSPTEQLVKDVVCVYSGLIGAVTKHGVEEYVNVKIANERVHRSAALMVEGLDYAQAYDPTTPEPDLPKCKGAGKV